MLFLTDIDKAKTTAQAKKKLKEYPRLKRMLGEKPEQRITANYSFESRGGSRTTRNSQVDAIVARKDEAERELDAIEQAVNLLSDELYKEIIFKSYLQAQKDPDYIIFGDLGISHTTFYSFRQKALLEFAESYRGGVLVVMNSV